MRNLFSLYYNNRIITTHSYGYAVNSFNSLQLRDLTATVQCTAFSICLVQLVASFSISLWSMLLKQQSSVWKSFKSCIDTKFVYITNLYTWLERDEK